MSNQLLTRGPESLGDAAGESPVGGAEELHDHAVADALEALDDDTLQKPEAHEDYQPLDKVEADADQALAVEAEQHNPLPTKPVLDGD